MSALVSDGTKIVNKLGFLEREFDAVKGGKAIEMLPSAIRSQFDRSSARVVEMMEAARDRVGGASTAPLAFAITDVSDAYTTGICSGILTTFSDS